MSVEVAEKNQLTAGRGDVSGTLVTVLLGLVRANRGEEGLAQTLALAGDDRPFAMLGDHDVGSSLDEAMALFNAVALVTGDGAVGLHVGELLLFSPHDTGFNQRIRALGSVEEVLRHVAPMAEHFESTSQAVALEVAHDHALIEVIPRDGWSRHAHLCELTRGLLSSLPTLFGEGPALISETECSARGGRRCLYAMSWDNPGVEQSKGTDPGPESVPTALPPAGISENTTKGATSDSSRSVASRVVRPGGSARSVDELEAELSRMSTLVEGTFATALELLGDDVESLLSQIASRADGVVSAHRYLLMVRVRPDTPIQLHYRGLEADEAQGLAAELWRDRGEHTTGSPLVVDIASPRRRYGRLAEFLPPSIADPSTEARVLRLYADYAATALDIFGVLSEARRSDATARTLLSFSEALSRVTTLAEVVQLLADTVPEVTDCDQAEVYLWDSQQRRLNPRACTGTSRSTSSPIVPRSDRGPRTDRSRARAGDEERRQQPTGPAGRSARPWAVPEIDEVATGPEDPAVTVDDSTPAIDRLIRHREVMVLDPSTDDPSLRALLDRSGTSASVIAPLFAAGEFLGVVAANYVTGSPTATIRDPDLHERLAGLADQASTAIQNLELLERVSHLAWHDALTGLPNRRLFEDRVEQELVRSRRVGEPVCMFFVDLDHFKMVNDTLGHAAGDDLIRQVGQRLVDTVRRQDTVARVGGDEFAILLPGLADQLAIDQLAQRSLEAMMTPFTVSGEEIETSASIGIAMAPDHGDSYDELLSRADEAMYRAKGRGRNAFEMYSGALVDSALGRQAIDQGTLHADLVRALENDEFFVLYQPYIDLQTTDVVGVEALVRWAHPMLGILEPASFISLAERTDVIVALDTWVLDQACRQARHWLDQGLPPLRISVNLATRDLSNPDLFDNIQRTLETTGVDPDRLELEITERVVLEKSGPARDNIERLRRLGVRFSIDDFGAGHSSLNRIGSFPVSTLKIDQSFVQVLGAEGDNNSLVASIISMADRLGLNCVAEGVETSLQSRVLLQRGCTTAQGYFFSPPLPPAGIVTLLSDITAADGRVHLRRWGSLTPSTAHHRYSSASSG